MDQPTLRLLSLGAGVQSTTLALLCVEGSLDRLDGAIFADTGWEPHAVYQQVDNLDSLLTGVGIPLYRVSNGNIRTDAIDVAHRYASLPYFVRNGDGSEGLGRRQCTHEYKLAPINRKVRELLGASPPKFRTVPNGKIAEQWIGFSTDEIGRVNNKRGVRYLSPRYPLIELGMSRRDCERFLKSRGWGDTQKSACIGCPFHGNKQWRDMRDSRPDEWNDAVAFDQAIRKGGARGIPLRGEAFLHRSLMPLDVAPVDRITRSEMKSWQVDLFDDSDLDLLEYGDPDGCSPYGCRSGSPGGG